MGDSRQPLFNDVPVAVIWLTTAVALTGVAAELSVPLCDLAFEWGAFVPAYAFDRPGPSVAIAPWLLHVFVHGSWLHLAMNTMALLAFGAATARPFGRGFRASAGFLLFFVVCALAGVAAELLVDPASRIPMVGASTGISGCLVASGWARGGVRGMLSMALPWLLINIVLALAGTQMWIAIAWAAHVGGLVAGAIFYPLFLAAFRQRH
ncbi:MULTISPECIES: rhomboid family intramembrane serine protease [Hyphobacterium]|uniref:Rhomboid family intramembrane serine protease n=1 Tax=Hyphobacterium vulgare TaxID=1736751 RepID=A0ABV7A0N8_9PROT